MKPAPRYMNLRAYLGRPQGAIYIHELGAGGLDPLSRRGDRGRPEAPQALPPAVRQTVLRAELGESSSSGRRRRRRRRRRRLHPIVFLHPPLSRDLKITLHAIHGGPQHSQSYEVGLSLVNKNPVPDTFGHSYSRGRCIGQLVCDSVGEDQAPNGPACCNIVLILMAMGE